MNTNDFLKCREYKIRQIFSAVLLIYRQIRLMEESLFLNEVESVFMAVNFCKK